MEPIEQLQYYTKPFIQVAQDTFTNFVNCKLTPNTPYMLRQGDTYEWDISGIIGLSGTIRGTVILSMKTPVATKLTQNLTGMEHTGIDEDVTDAIGEIVNIISGNMKREIEEGDNIKISLPTIIRGKECIFSWPSKQARRLCIPFTVFQGETIYLLVAFEPEKSGEEAVLE